MMSEYIEGMLTGLSPEENKILQQLQQNRKKTLQRANNAATLIQNNWKKLDFLYFSLYFNRAGKICFSFKILLILDKYKTKDLIKIYLIYNTADKLFSYCNTHCRAKQFNCLLKTCFQL